MNDVFYPSVPPISLELTSKCNLKCPYCANGQLDRPPGFIDWDLLEKIVEECADGRHDIATLHGTGEPLLWDRLEDAIRLIRRKRAGSGSFATNATLLSAARVERLLDAGLKAIRISLDSLDERIYAATRGGKVQKVIANTRGLIELAPPDFRITIVLMRHKDQAIGTEQIARFYRTFGFHENVRLEVVDNGLMVSAPHDFRESPVKVRHCTRPREWFTITSEGKVSICCSDQNALQVLGDVRTQTIDEIWYSPQVQRIFANIALGRGRCPDVCTRHCWLEEPPAEAENEVDKCGEWPFTKSLALLEELVLEAKFTRAMEVLSTLEMRDPGHNRLAYFADILRRSPCGLRALHPEELQSEIRRLSEDALAKDQLIRKHHDFAQRLLNELVERGIKVTTRWDK